MALALTLTQLHMALTFNHLHIVNLITNMCPTYLSIVMCIIYPINIFTYPLECVLLIQLTQLLIHWLMSYLYN